MSPIKSPLNLSVKINAAFYEAQSAAAVARTAANDAVKNALECGQLLREQKAALPHGRWEKWLLLHCPEISASTARRYMRLSQRTQASGLLPAGGLVQAYLATGVLPHQKSGRIGPTKVPSFADGLDHFRRWFHARTQGRPVEKWSPKARRILRNELQWFVRLHETLREPLASCIFYTQAKRGYPLARSSQHND